VIRLGLVGVGAWGKRYADTLARRSDCRLVAVARGSARPEERVFGAPVCSDWRQLLELDGVIVASTPDNQAEVVAAAIEHGTPVLAEKPLGLTREVSQRLFVRWRAVERRAPVLVNYIHLWAPAFVELATLLRARGGAAAVRSIVSQGSSNGPFREWSTLYDYGSHDCAMLLRLLGVRGFEITAARSLATSGRGELFEFALRAGDTAVELTLGNGAGTKTRSFVVTLADAGTLAYDDLQPHPNKLTLDGAPVPIATTPALDAVLEDYVTRIGHWQRTAAADEGGEGDLELCRDVSGLLDELAAHASLAK
jgi:predicted dehydrogenase